MPVDFCAEFEYFRLRLRRGGGVKSNEIVGGIELPSVCCALVLIKLRGGTANENVVK